MRVPTRGGGDGERRRDSPELLLRHALSQALLRSPSRRPELAIALAVAAACSQANPRSNPCPGGRFRLTPATPPPLTAVRRRQPSPAPPPHRPIRSEPSDPNPTIQIRSKPGSNQTHTGQPLAFLQKRPSVLQKSTRSPYLFKRNSKSAQNFSHKPLISSEI